jgi:hypothetical protein
MRASLATRSAKISGVRWLRQWREAREARGERRREDLRQLHGELRHAVVRLMSDYDCQIEQGDDWIEVRGGPGACPFHIWMPDSWVNLAAGDKGEYVPEWVISLPEELADMVALLRRIAAGDLVDLPLGLNKTRLEGYSGYVPSPQGERPL